ncbi:MAG: UTP--glucose-1-phosphate uridylyltransferase [Gammaproteobacteria bacterium]|nr:MAG: UTP--glucose-1-phosphate uridylyltransferase [Gammaproteobacteria bacterium]TND07017.1 MAG: UTP--glucose-1-phosphate uridylyltransferase [Gammaproteobacteria bacterium]
MTRKLKKAVFPVAGMGTRFLPATKANPKEMLPIVDKPLIQYAAEEAIAAGITELIFVTSSSKRAIEDHFDKNYEMEAELEKRGKYDLLEILRGVVPKGVSCVYVRQPEALGLGHAVGCARDVVGEDPFAVILADDLIDGGGRSCLRQMVEIYDQRGCSVLGVEQVSPDETDKYGIVKAREISERLYEMDSIVEKPRPSDAPSDLGVVGRYILTPRIFQMLEHTRRGAGGEIQLTDAIARLLAEEKVYAYRFHGKRYDCGDKLGYLKATVEYALQHPVLKDGFRRYLGSLLPITDTAAAVPAPDKSRASG